LEAQRRRWRGHAWRDLGPACSREVVRWRVHRVSRTQRQKVPVAKADRIGR
jgi:hypothetical protein